MRLANQPLVVYGSIVPRAPAAPAAVVIAKMVTVNAVFWMFILLSSWVWKDIRLG